MHKIPDKLRAQMHDDPYMHVCARADFECEGRVTWEHAFIHAGKQIQERWAIIPLCVYHHLGPGLNKEINQMIALSHATDEELAKYPKTDWEQMKKYLFKKYAVPTTFIG